MMLDVFWWPVLWTQCNNSIWSSRRNEKEFGMAKAPNYIAHIQVLTNISIASMVVMKRDFTCNDVEAFVKSGLSLTLSLTVKVIRNPAHFANRTFEECETLRQGRDSEVPRQLLCFPIQQQEAQTRVSAGAVCTARRAQKLPTAGESLMKTTMPPFPTAAEKRQQKVCCVLMSFVILWFFTKHPGATDPASVFPSLRSLVLTPCCLPHSSEAPEAYGCRRSTWSGAGCEVLKLFNS